MLKIQSLSIENIGGTSKADVNFHHKMNVICGPNGVGKTTILDIIVHMSQVIGSDRLKKRVGTSGGKASAKFHSSGSEVKVEILVNHFEPSSTEHYTNTMISPSDILYLRNIRLFDWQKLSAISADPILNRNQIGQRNSRGIPNADAKNWFANRFLYSKHENALTRTQMNNYEIAKKSLAVLDAETQFSHVEASTNEVMVRTPKGLIPFEYLSSGFKTCITIFWGLIKEIEYCRKKGDDGVVDFDGIVLIDELEIHLHPVWQSKILKSLKSIFPAAQFIVSTHSPHIVQSAECGEVMPLEMDEEGYTHIRHVPNLKHGLSMWTIEEVLEDIMGMKDTRTDAFSGFMKNFERAIMSNNIADAEEIFEHLEGSLHPQSSVKKILALQIASIKGLDN
jgi:predicted ATP-binding protein involved in virulence